MTFALQTVRENQSAFALGKNLMGIHPTAMFHRIPILPIMPAMNVPNIRVLPSVEAIAMEAADRIVNCARESVELFDRFTLFLSGGSTPKPLYELLATDDFADAMPWAKTQVFLVDERCVPPDHAESNYGMISENLLSKVPLPRDNIYRMKGEIEPEAAAKEYGKMLQEHFAEYGPDFILLGMGSDGHTASLFPHSEALDEPKHRCVAHYVENSTTGKSWRITLTPPFINTARDVLVLVAGENKAKVLQEVLEGPRDPKRLPMQLIGPEHGRMTYLIDVLAAGMADVE